MRPHTRGRCPPLRTSTWVSALIHRPSVSDCSPCIFKSYCLDVVSTCVLKVESRAFSIEGYVTCKGTRNSLFVCFYFFPSWLSNCWVCSADCSGLEFKSPAGYQSDTTARLRMKQVAIAVRTSRTGGGTNGDRSMAAFRRLHLRLGKCPSITDMGYAAFGRGILKLSSLSFVPQAFWDMGRKQVSERRGEQAGLDNFMTDRWSNHLRSNTILGISSEHSSVYRRRPDSCCRFEIEIPPDQMWHSVASISVRY